jgi:phosphohistidine phosphatase SixA
MGQRRTLLILRHAQTEDTRPGSRDSERRLTPDGERDAEQVGDHLRKQGITIDKVLCSSAARTRQTLELLKLDVQLDPDRVEIADLFTTRVATPCLTPSTSFPTIATSPC